MSDKRVKSNPERIHRRNEQDRSSLVITHAGAVKGVVGAAFPRFVRALAVAIGVLAGATAPSLTTATEKTPAEFISTGANEVLAEMRSAASLDEKEAYFRQLLHQDFDMDEISRFVLGPYWRSASPEQQQEFRALLEKHITLSHGRRLAEASGGDFRVTGSRTDPNGFVFVTGEMIAPRARGTKWIFNSVSLTGFTRSRTSLSIMSAWHRATVLRSNRCWRATAGNSGRC